MDLKWADIAIQLSPELAAETAEAWQWMVPGPWRCLVCSMFGRIFLEKLSGGVYWLECGTGLIERVADNAAAFNDFMRSERNDAWWGKIDEWFLPSFVYELHEAGKKPEPGQCFGLTILPIFEGGVYEVGNVFVVSVREWLTVSGSLHQQMSDLPDGQQVRLVVTD